MGTIFSQLTDGLSVEEIKAAGLDPYYVAHGLGVYPASAAGIPFSAVGLQSKGNPVADLYENMAAEQKAKATYDYLIDLTDDPDVLRPLRFLREREIVHFQRFGECLDILRDYMNEKRMIVMPEINLLNK